MTRALCRSASFRPRVSRSEVVVGGEFFWLWYQIINSVLLSEYYSQISLWLNSTGRSLVARRLQREQFCDKEQNWKTTATRAEAASRSPRIICRRPSLIACQSSCDTSSLDPVFASVACTLLPVPLGSCSVSFWALIVRCHVNNVAVKLCKVLPTDFPLIPYDFAIQCNKSAVLAD
jgi:hypothetical protein